VWEEMIKKHPDTIITLDAVKKAIEILKQKMEKTRAASSTSSPAPGTDPYAIDWSHTVPFPNFSQAGASSSSAPTTILERV
jgi:hypothetical protein